MGSPKERHRGSTVHKATARGPPRSQHQGRRHSLQEEGSWEVVQACTRRCKQN